LLAWLVRRPPRNVGEALERSAVCLTAAVLVAPTSRAGYLLYPLVLAATARYWMRGAEPAAPGAGIGSEFAPGRRAGS
jgi:hypothetical protein